MPDQIAEHWHLFKDHLQKAIDHGQGESSLTDYLRLLLNWQAQLWVFTTDEGEIKGVGLTKFIEYSQHKTLHIVAVSGTDWADWAEEFYLVEQFAKENGCVAVEQWGRPGWSKILPRVIPGFEVAYHVMRKNIT